MAYNHVNEPVRPMLKPLTHPSNNPDSRNMTWQQKEAIAASSEANKRKFIRWKPLDLAAKQFAIEQADNRNAQKAESAIPPSITPQPPPTSSTQKSNNKPRRRHRRKNKNTSQDQSMVTLPASAYVPPHLRKPKTTAVAVAAEAPVAAVATPEPSTPSNKSKASQSGKLDSTPIGTNLPHSPPTTAKDSGRDESKAAKPSVKVETPPKQVSEHPGWDTPKPAAPSPPKKGNPRWPRGNIPRKKTVWPKWSDMRPPSDASSDHGGVTFKSNSNGDPDYDVKKLLAWNGDWMPPPEDWAARRGYSGRNFGREMEKWMNGHSRICVGNIQVENHATEFLDDCKEVVPRYWIVPSIEGQSMTQFWKNFLDRAPAPLDECDVVANPPFWERMENEPSYFINGLQVPDARVDPDDENNHLPVADPLITVDERLQMIMDRRRRKAARQALKRRPPPPSPDIQKVYQAPPVDERLIRPTSNIYLRPVQPADVEGITKIYNYYVKNTIHANEFEARTEAQMGARVDSVVKAGLPFLVAIAKAKKATGPKGYVSDRVVGYISLDDYCDQSSMYRFTFDMELYVHYGFEGHKIAQCLLDKLLEMCNTGYKVRGGYEYRNEFEYLKLGPGRVIKTIMLTAHKEHGENDTVTYDYLKPFGFTRSGHINRVGYKYGKVVDAYFYAHYTSENIEPNSIPMILFTHD